MFQSNRSALARLAASWLTANAVTFLTAAACVIASVVTFTPQSKAGGSARDGVGLLWRKPLTELRFANHPSGQGQVLNGAKRR